LAKDRALLTCLVGCDPSKISIPDTLWAYFSIGSVRVDIKEGRIGVLGTDTQKLKEVKERLPRKVWTFVTPKSEGQTSTGELDADR
jgi:hypothetical protein